MRERRRISVQGVVQGVGFRPFAHGLAVRFSLDGHVINDMRGAAIEVEGEPEALEAFLHALEAERPPLASIEQLTWHGIPARGEQGFAILESVAVGEHRALITPDATVCTDCLRELFDARDQRHGYPFINCTNCGPRFTIVRDVPYDRPLTTMAAFEMCPACRTEYEDPASRRFHAQPNACPDCGPRLSLLARDGSPLGAGLHEAAGLICDGAILAIKGLGGYHLACDALNQDAVAALRARKQREDKPFAVMVADVEGARALAEVNEAEVGLLASVQRPIVLLRKRDGSRVADAVAPGNRDLGVMLAYTPLHHLLLLETQRPLVMTSGNLSDEPIAYRDDEALQRLAGIADYFLVHDREIETRCDDSVLRYAGSRQVMIRRSRGFVPEPIGVKQSFRRPVLATGGHLKNTFCLGKDTHAFVSHHIGDLENYETLRSFEQGIQHFQRLFDVRPQVVAHDMHPDYLSTQYARELQGVKLIAVQHHHAHIAACMAEHGLEEPVIGVAFDGSGFGSDGTIWGGEFLVAGYTGFERAAHLEYVPLPGGEKAVREPWRVAAAWLHQTYGDAMMDLPVEFVARLQERPWRLLRQMIEKQTNCPPASSVGRLFDAVSALIGLRDVARYEGQAAVELEMAADEDASEAYELPLAPGRPHVLQASEVVRQVVQDLRRGEAVSTIAARFHNGIAAAIVDVCSRIRDERGLTSVCLSGGVFQNALLLRRAVTGLEAAGFDVYVPARLPPNDGGISLGQAVVANAIDSAAEPATANDHRKDAAPLR